jgi:hypothetical protein
MQMESSVAARFCEDHFRGPIDGSLSIARASRKESDGRTFAEDGVLYSTIFDGKNFVFTLAMSVDLSSLYP